jgi:hypothetical protein
MSYDDQQLDRLRTYLEQCTGRRRPTPGGIKATLSDNTAKIDGRFVELEQCDPRTLEKYQPGDVQGIYRIVEAPE